MGLKNRTLLLALLVFISAGAVSANVDDLQLVGLSGDDAADTGDSNPSMKVLSHAISPGTPVGVNLTVNNSQEMEYSVLDRNNNSQYDAGTDFISSKNITTTGTSVYVGNFSSSNTSLLSHGNYTVYGLQDTSGVSDGYSLSGEENVTLEVDNTTPKISNFQLSDYNSSYFQISFNSNESLSEVQVDVEKQEAQQSSANLYVTLSDSSFSNSSLTYSAEFKKGIDANYTATLNTAEDLTGNDGGSGQETHILKNASGPTYSSSHPSDTLASNLEPYISILMGDFSGVDSSTIEVDINDSEGRVLENGGTGLSGISYSSENLTVNMSELGSSLSAGQVNVSINSSDNDGHFRTAQFSFKADDNPPSIYGFNVTNETVDTIGVEFESLEELDVIRVNVRDAANNLLNAGAFTESDAGTNFLYEATYTTSGDGNYSFSLERAEDIYGNNRNDYSIEGYVEKENKTRVTGFAANNVSEKDIMVTFNSSEQLDNIFVNITGQEDAKLTESEFSTSDSSAPYNYSATYKAGYDGTYNFDLEHANDSFGGFRATDSVTTDSVEIDRLPEIYDFELYYSGTDVDLKINSSVQLVDIKAQIRTEDGSINENRTESVFSEKDSNGFWIYRHNVSSTNGYYNATLYTANDSSGNDAANLQFDELLVQTDAPQDPLNTRIMEDANKYNDGSLHVNTTFNSVPGDDITLYLEATDEDGNSHEGTTFFQNPQNNYLNASFDISSLNDGEITIKSKVDKGGTFNPSNYTAENTFVKDTVAPVVESAYTGGLGGNGTDRDRIVLNVTEKGIGMDSFTVSSLRMQVNDSSDTELGIEDVMLDGENIVIDLVNDLKTNQTGSLKFTDNVTDEYGQPIDRAPTYSVQDGLRPLASNAVINSSKSSSSETWVTVEFDDNLITNSASASIDGSGVTVEGTNGGELYLSHSGALDTAGASLTAVSGLKDSAGNTAAVEGGSIPVKSFEKEIVSGWNLVSFPIADGKSYSIDLFIDTSNIDYIWSHSNGEWQIYEPGAPSDFSQFKGGKGYMIKANTGFKLAPQVDTADTESADTSFSIDSGWNLVGHLEEYNQTADTGGAFSSLSTVNTVRAQTSDGSLTYGATTYATPGDAYWVDSGSSDTLTGGFASTTPDYFNWIGEIFNIAAETVIFW